ncbi:phosphotransferase [Sulfitobacter albidus]|uniref:Phosphotransferase n=1 Tax=Sulfitobacter albidus TaxID=2829501 RepID=A0A975JCW9_9RHOB|nr:phosphotransferase [Sulfitobacter albidus]QUJ76164.1 phosphotransferase [Sulfitobacter albidus]
MTDRAERITTFIAASGWQGAERAFLAGDASNRRYDRLIAADGRSAVLMDAPPEKGEDVRPFIAIATHLAELGLSAPKIFASDHDAGLLLIEDLGDRLFKPVIAADPALEETLYAAAVDVLTVLHRAEPPSGLAPYDTPLLTQYAALAYDWYAFARTGARDTAAQADFEAAFAPLMAGLSHGPQVLVQRDYHAENLLWLPDRSGVARVGLLDFQDALLGHPAYDLVSILQDARRDVPRQIEDAMIARYLDQNPQDPERFRADYALLGVQRNLRIMGAFARLCLRDGKPGYVDLMPRVWEFVERNLAHPALDSVAKIVRETLPSPTQELRDLIRSKVA